MKKSNFLVGMICGLLIFNLMSFKSNQVEDKEGQNFHVSLNDEKAVIYESNTGEFIVIKNEYITNSGNFKNFDWSKN